MLCRALATVAIVISAGACGVSGDQRVVWLHNTLIEDNWLFFERDTSLAEGKMLLMAADRYSFLRGTSGQFWRDHLTPSAPIDVATDFGSDELVVIVGDAHPENIGTYYSGDGEVVVEFNDFDAANYGPFYVDVRRLALGFEIGTALLIQAALVDESFYDAAAQAVVDGYVDEIARIAAGEDSFTANRLDHGRIIRKLIDEALEDEGAAKYLADYTTVADGARTMYFGEVDPPVIEGVIDDETVMLSAAEQDMLQAALQNYQDVTGHAREFEVLGMSRRLGAGVSSYPSLRYYVLTAGPTDSINDDVLLEFKEVRDPQIVPNSAAQLNRDFESASQRIVATQVLLHGGVNDAYLGWSAAGRVPFRVRHRQGAQQGFGVDKLVEKIEEGDWSFADYVEFAGYSGRILARSHCAATTHSGGEPVVVVSQLLAQRESDFAQETMNFVAAYRDVVLTDYELLVGLVERHGPDLGYRRIVP